MSTVRDYFADVSTELSRRSERLRLGFSSHKGTIGTNRERAVADLLRQYLPKRFGIGGGLLLARTGEFSNQADLLITDDIWNAALYPEAEERLWLIESVYALIEVKTTFSPTTFADSLEKCRRFKSLPRSFDDIKKPSISDSLFIMWAFEGPSPERINEIVKNEIIGKVPVSEQPDFIIVPNSVLVIAGTYLQLTTVGQEGSAQRLASGVPANIENLCPIKTMHLNEHSLLVLIMWLTSWLKAAGHRSAPVQTYLGDAAFEYGKFI